MQAVFFIFTVQWVNLEKGFKNISLQFFNNFLSLSGNDEKKNFGRFLFWEDDKILGFISIVELFLDVKEIYHLMIKQMRSRQLRKIAWKEIERI